MPLFAAIAVIGGSGHQGRGLAQRLVIAGEHVIIGSRDRERAQAAVDGWPPRARAGEVLSNRDAIARAEVAILAVPFSTVGALLAEVAGQFKPDILVIDVTVPVTFVDGKMTMIDVAEGSAAQHVRAQLPPHVRLGGAFKTVPAHLLEQLDRPLDCDEFVCGDSDGARAQASDVVRLIPGLRAVDVGPLSRAASVEHVTALAI